MGELILNPACPHCGSAKTIRVERKGFMQKQVLARLGQYPWECGDCKTRFMFKFRGKLKRKRRTTGEVHLPPVG